MNAISDKERAELEDLLPWHATGALDARDAARIDQAVASDPELARRLELVREEMAADVHLHELLGAPSPKALDSLFARIDAEPVRRPRLAVRIGAQVSAFFDSLTPRTLVWAAAAAALVIVVQGGVIASGVLSPKAAPAAVYNTASGPGRPAAVSGSVVVIRFAPAATIEQTTRLLDANAAKIVEGPVSGGLYRVQVSEKPLPAAELKALIARLEMEKTIDFVAPSE